MGLSVAAKLIASHLVEGRPNPGEEIGLRIDQTLTQDATGTTVMLELEAMGLKRVRTELSAQYVDHNLLQTDWKNADDHLFLRSACERFGIWFSRPGNGVSHPVHMQRFGIPGKSLVGSDSHTPAAGSLGMLAFGAGGLEVALAMAGEPFYVRMPKIWGVKLIGRLPEWVSAKDVILELLRRHGVQGGVGRIIEYYGPGLDQLAAMDRHTIANMGTELGSTTTVFPSDGAVRHFLETQGRGSDWVEIAADPDAEYDITEEIDLSQLEPLIALPSSPGNVVPVREVAGAPIYQAYVGSSGNPGLRDMAIAARMVEGRNISPGVSFDICPTSRQTLENMIEMGLLGALVKAGARLHQAGCNGCIGMGQAPATHEISLRTVPRNFPGRSGTKDDQVYLCSPETATAGALTGRITDPRTLGIPYPADVPVDEVIVNTVMMEAPPADGTGIELRKGPNISLLPEMPPLAPTLTGPVLLKVGDNISTDEIMPAGDRVLPYRSNIPAISHFVFSDIDPKYYERAMAARDRGRGGSAATGEGTGESASGERWSGHFVIGGNNYGQGSSREHAALAPRYLGLQAVIAKSFARIHAQNLVNFGILPLTFVKTEDYDGVNPGDELRLPDVARALRAGRATLTVENLTRENSFEVRHALSPRQIEMILCGGLLPVFRHKLQAAA